MQIPHTENEKADSLANMAFTSPMNITQYVPMELLHKLTIEEA